MFPDFGTPKMTIKSNKTGVILGRKVLLEQRESLWRIWRRKSDTGVRTLRGVSSGTEEQRTCRAEKQQVLRRNVLVFKKQNAPRDGKGRSVCYPLPELQMHP